MGGCESCVMRQAANAEGVPTVNFEFKRPPQLDEDDSAPTPATMSPPETPAVQDVSQSGSKPEILTKTEGLLECYFGHQLPEFSKRFVIIDERSLRVYQDYGHYERKKAMRQYDCAELYAALSEENRMYFNIYSKEDDKLLLVGKETKNSFTSHMGFRYVLPCPQRGEWVEAINYQSERPSLRFFGA